MLKQPGVAVFLLTGVHILSILMIVMGGTKRKQIYPGLDVSIVLKEDQKTGKLTRGVVKDILTSSESHHRGIKVRLLGGEVGRVQKIHPDIPGVDKGYQV